MKKSFIALIAAILGFAHAGAQGTDYGLPANINDGNILHCFNWSINDVKADLPKIAEAGFGAVQLSPLQRRNVQKSHVWSDVYRPYDFAFQESPALGTADDLKALCAEAEKYGIKVIVDVVANHVDKAAGYHDPWWDTDGYVRSWGGNANINYSNRYSITHDRLGDYGEVNSENPEVIKRAKAYVEWLRDAGVKGIRWDAAKHIGLPSEGCDFWSEVTSVPGMFHYGEILGTPAATNYDALMEEYAEYMWVTDSRYSDESAESNGGLPTRKNGEWAPLLGPGKLVYWGETHDTYSNTPDYGGWSSSVAQETVDRAYAAVACRDGATALYLSRPNASGYSNIKVTKGSDHYTSPSVSEVNKFRNKMAGRSEYFSTNTAGNAISVTRNNGGAVVVCRTSGQFAVPNGGSLCPAGSYTDRVSGATITVTAETISGTAGPSGIVVIYNDQLEEPDENAPEQGYDDNNITVYYDNSDTKWNGVNIHYWGASQTTWPGIAMTRMENDKYGRDIYSVSVPSGCSGLFVQSSGSPQTVDSPGALKANHIYKGLATTTGGKHNLSDMGAYGESILIYYDNSETQYTSVCCHYWGGSSTSTFPGVEMSKVEGDVWSLFIPATTTGILFAQKDKAKQTVDITNVHDGYIYKGLTELSGTKNQVSDGKPYSGIVDAEAQSLWSVRTSAGTIRVEGLEGKHAAIVGIDGRAIYSGSGQPSVEVSVTPGIYIVTTGARSQKVAVTN